MRKVRSCLQNEGAGKGKHSCTKQSELFPGHQAHDLPGSPAPVPTCPHPTPSRAHFLDTYVKTIYLFCLSVDYLPPQPQNISSASVGFF